MRYAPMPEDCIWRGAGPALYGQGKGAGLSRSQFNAVVKSNTGAIHLYEKLGFVRLGEVPGGFMCKDGSYEDIVLFYHIL